MRKVNSKVIRIDGEKFKSLLESASGKTLKEISLENGFSDSFLRMVVKTGKASPSAIAVAKLYGIDPSAYEYVEPRVTTLRALEYEKEQKQLTIDDLTQDKINEAVNKALSILLPQHIDKVVNNAFNLNERIDAAFKSGYARGYDKGYAYAKALYCKEPENPNQNKSDVGGATNE